MPGTKIYEICTYIYTCVGISICTHTSKLFELFFSIKLYIQELKKKFKELVYHSTSSIYRPLDLSLRLWICRVTIGLVSPVWIQRRTTGRPQAGSGGEAHDTGSRLSERREGDRTDTDPPLGVIRPTEELNREGRATAASPPAVAMAFRTRSSQLGSRLPRYAVRGVELLKLHSSPYSTNGVPEEPPSSPILPLACIVADGRAGDDAGRGPGGAKRKLALMVDGEPAGSASPAPLLREVLTMDWPRRISPAELPRGVIEGIPFPVLLALPASTAELEEAETRSDRSGGRRRWEPRHARSSAVK